MTAILITVWGLIAVYGVYLATLTARSAATERAFIDADGCLPGWAAVFAGAGVIAAGIGVPEYLTLLRRFGLQFSHVSVGLVIVALAAVLIQKRLWIAARVASLGSPGDALGRYYQSVTLRLAVMILSLLFGLPFAATALGQMGAILAGATDGVVGTAAAIWVLGFFMFLSAVIGGWRGTVLNVAMLSVLVAVLVGLVAGFSEALLPTGGFFSRGIPVADGILPDRIPGVVQYSAGIGKDVAQGGIWTTVAIASATLSLAGVALAPGFLYLGMSTREGKAFAFGPVWMVAGVLAGILLIGGPLLAARLGDAADAFEPLADALLSKDILAACALYVLLLAAGQIAVSFFVNSSTLLLTRELLLPYIVPGLDQRRGRLTARIALAVAYLLLAALAAYAPVWAMIFGTLALPLSVQLLPAFLGLAFVPWISRSAVLTGLVIGGLLVLFTEPPGLLLFEGLFVDLPWGRWPLTVHSAAWGLAFNAAAVLLVSIFTRKGTERDHRDRLHAEFAARWRCDFGGRAARGAKWSLTLIWAFLAIGPGAILGNSFFSQPVFTEGDAALGVPSLWVWQILFWLIGIPLVWWLAYSSRLGITSTDLLRPITLDEEKTLLERERAPNWIARGVARLTERRGVQSANL